MPSRIIPSTGAVKEPVCSHAAELHNAAIYTKEQVAELLGCSVRYVEPQIRAEFAAA